VTNDVRIRLMLEADAEDIARILRETGWFDHMAEEAAHETALRTRAQVAMYLADDSHTVYVAENASGQVVGYASTHWLPSMFLPGSQGYVSELFVENAYRGKRIGARLLEAVASEGSRRNCWRLMLTTNRNRESYQREFYAKRGWIERDTIANFVLKL
jgi:GNAT superfamily N-acetyltransferase